MLLSDEEKQMTEVLAKNIDALNKSCNVFQAGIGYKVKGGEVTDQFVLVFFVTKKMDSITLASKNISDVSEFAGGFQTDVIEMPNGFRPLADDTRYRPFEGGVATIRFGTNATGTLGLVVRRRGEPRALYGLTNNHVGANVDIKGMLPAAASRWDPWVQPGAHGGGSVRDDVIAKLFKWNKLIPRSPYYTRIQKLNYYDVAIGKITRDIMSSNHAVPNSIMNIGAVGGIEEPKTKDFVQKRGRTTELTNGQIIHKIPFPRVVTVDYGYQCDFTDQFIITGTVTGIPFSDEGDSGSVVVKAEKNKETGKFPIVALLFAGGIDSKGRDYTIASPIKKIADDFKLII